MRKCQAAEQGGAPQVGPGHHLSWASEVRVQRGWSWRDRVWGVEPAQRTLATCRVPWTLQLRAHVWGTRHGKGQEGTESCAHRAGKDAWKSFPPTRLESLKIHTSGRVLTRVLPQQQRITSPRLNAAVVLTRLKSNVQKDPTDFK